MYNVLEYLPILSVSRQNLAQHERLFDSLIGLLAVKGVRVSVIEETFLSIAGGDGLQDDIRHTIERCHLVVAAGGEEENGESLGRLLLGPGHVHDSAGYAFHCTGEATLAGCSAAILQWLAARGTRTPVYGCILIGGKSSRMGRPKHLIRTAEGQTWLERTVSLLAGFTERTMISGTGALPAHLAHLERLADIPAVSGPLSGVGAALQSVPLVSWLVLACDMPEISVESIRWLLAQRRPGAAAVIPYNPLSDRSEPLAAWYDFRSAPLVEELLARGERRMTSLCQQDGVYEPVIPESLRPCWRNVNRPTEL